MNKHHLMLYENFYTLSIHIAQLHLKVYVDMAQVHGIQSASLKNLHLHYEIRKMIINER